MPGFLGGSDLAVPVHEQRTRRWRPTGSRTSRARATERALQAKGNIPNATNLLGTSVNERAAARSWFVPTAKHWVDVENGNILKQHARADPDRQAAPSSRLRASASDNITSVLNGVVRPAERDGATATGGRRRDRLQWSRRRRLTCGRLARRLRPVLR